MQNTTTRTSAAFHNPVIRIMRREPTLQERVESLLDVRTKPLVRSPLKADREEIACHVLSILTESIHLKKPKEVQEYRKLVKSFSRLIALYASENGSESPITAISPEMRDTIAALGAHLQVEISLAIENAFSQSHFFLSKFSFEEVNKKYLMLANSPDPIVVSNAKTILNFCISHSDLDICDDIITGAQKKYEELAAHPDETVRNNAKTIINTAMNGGNLKIADELASGAQKKYEKLTAHPDETVRNNAKTIISIALNRGNLKIADELALGAQKKYEKLTAHPDETVRNNAKTIIYAALNGGNLKIADEFASGAQKKYEWLTKHNDPIVRANANAIISRAIDRGNLDLIEKFVSELLLVRESNSG